MAYPTTLDSFPSSATLAGHNLDTDPHSTLHGNLGTAVAALEAKVGVDSSAITTTVDYKLNNLGGDVTGTVGASTVAKIQGKPVSATAPTNAQLMLFDGTTWNPKSLSGDATVTNLGAVTLATVNAGPGTTGDATHVTQLTTNGKGLVTSNSSVAIALSASGDATGTLPGALTLATVNSSPGTTGDGTHVTQMTTNGKGLVTANSSVAISASGIGALVAANNLSDVTASTARTNLGLGTSSAVQHGTLGLGQALDSNASTLELADTSTVSTDIITSGGVTAVSRVNDTRSFTVTQASAGTGDAIAAARLNAAATIASTKSMDYTGHAIGGALGGSGTGGKVSAYTTHFDIGCLGGATMHAGYLAHIGNVQSSGLVVNSAAFVADTINALVGQATISDNPLSSGATTIHLNTAGTLPSSGNYYATIDNEIVQVTAGQGTTTLTVTRAQGGTTAAAHAQNATLSASGVENATGFLCDDGAISAGAQQWGLRVGNYQSRHRGKLGIGGSSTTSTPTARLDILEPTANADVMRIGTTAGGSGTDPILERIIQNNITTTDATATQLFGLTMAANKTHSVDFQIIWHRTGGSAGSTNDGGAMRVVLILKYDGTTVTQIGTTQTIYNVGSVAISAPVLGTFAFGIQGFNITGIANTNYSWHCTARVCVLGS